MTLGRLAVLHSFSPQRVTYDPSKITSPYSPWEFVVSNSNCPTLMSGTTEQQIMTRQMPFIDLIVPTQLSVFFEEGNSETLFINEHLSLGKDGRAVPLEFWDHIFKKGYIIFFYYLFLMTLLSSSILPSCECLWEWIYPQASYSISLLLFSELTCDCLDAWVPSWEPETPSDCQVPQLCGYLSCDISLDTVPLNVYITS